MKLHTLYLDNPLTIRRAVDVAEPLGEPQTTALFYIHGGGWKAGARDSFHQHLEHFASAGYWCASVGYRLAPQAKLDAQLQDITEGYVKFLEWLQERNADIRHIVVIGSSAGAHLASLLALIPPEQWDEAVRTKWRQPDACVSINGPGTLELWPDMNASIRESIEAVIGASYDNPDDAPAFAKASPDRYVRPGCADFLFIVVEHEQFFPHDAVYRMSDRIRAQGAFAEVVYVAEAEHGFFYGVHSPLQRKAMEVLEPFIRRYGE